jgi:uncharacterized protein YaaQ
LSIPNSVDQPSSFNPTETSAVTRLMFAVIQVGDVENASVALAKAGFMVTRLSSTGGFLGRRNVTLLIGLADEQIETALQIFQTTCHRRLEYITTPLEGTTFPLPLTTSVSVGGATIFTFEVERYEEIQ